jgi:hypothetical protein
MNERTMRKPLSGAECIDIIIADFRRALERDCSLAAHCSYAAVSHKTICMIEYQTTGDLTKTEVRTQHIEGKFDPTRPVEKTGTEVAGAPKPPNEARRDAGLPIPVATTGDDGKVVEKFVSYRNADRT